VRSLKDWYCLVITADFSAKMDGYSSISGDINNKENLVVSPHGQAKITTDEYAVTVTHEMLHYCNVQHHGNIGKSLNNIEIQPREQEKKICIVSIGANSVTFDPINLFWDDPLGTPITPQDPIFKNPKGSISVRLRLQHGTCSGVEDCIMRYDDAQAYKGADGNYYLLLNWQTGYSELTGINLCTSNTGTGVNDKEHKPRSRYGDAANGNCQSQVCTNDKYQ